MKTKAIAERRSTTILQKRNKMKNKNEPTVVPITPIVAQIVEQHVSTKRYKEMVVKTMEKEKREKTRKMCQCWQSIVNEADYTQMRKFEFPMKPWSGGSAQHPIELPRSS